MSGHIAIKVDKVSKTFKLPHEKNNSIKGAVLNFYKRNRTFEKQQVLDDISFEVKKGEFFGIVGRNGSGKSTLLKLIAGIYTPTKGKVKVNGNLTPFIELGVGFNPELTGRENVYMNGALLGFNRLEMNEMYDEIVNFAELEKFMDQKLKNYSSGMQVRLAFSIAIRADTDVLIFDEVLAVGDERFQDKCINVFEDLKKANKTIVLVTHDMSSVKRFCDRAIVVNKGNIIYEGAPNEASDEYVKINFPETISSSDDLLTGTKNVSVKFKPTEKNDSQGSLFKSGDKITLQVNWKSNQKAKNVGVAIYSESGQYMFGTNTIVDKVKISENTIDYEFINNLGSGNYYTQVGIFGDRDSEKIYYLEEALKFKVTNNEGWQGFTKLEHAWRQK